MKVKKFNDIILNENIINESWSLDKFNKIQKLKNEIEEINESTFPLLLDYLKLNTNILDEPEIIQDDEDELITVKDFEYLIQPEYYGSIKNVKMIITILDYSNDDYDIYLTEDNVLDLVKYLKNPDLYKNSKKYNL